jgi:hypothetical protein
VFLFGSRPETSIMTKSPAVFFAAIVAATSLFSAPAWTPSTWNGERAFVLETPAWRAVVSVERARLVQFNATGRETSFVFAPPTKDNPIGWGGHRVWLGPQTTWRAIWPPPDAWEKHAAENANADGARLQLQIADAGDGWPRLTRVYELVGKKLACRVLVAAGGTRDAQIIQIFQAPPPRDLVLRRKKPDATFPLGFALLPPVANRSRALPATTWPAQAQATATADGARLHQTDQAEKLGFPPQDIVAVFDEASGLRVARDITRGVEAGAPDAGFYSQVYLGEARTPVIELEQLSPLFKAGEAAEFSVMLDVAP